MVGAWSIKATKNFALQGGHSWKQTLQQGSNHAYYLQQEEGSGTFKGMNIILS